MECGCQWDTNNATFSLTSIVICHTRRQRSMMSRVSTCLQVDTMSTSEKRLFWFVPSCCGTDKLQSLDEWTEPPSRRNWRSRNSSRNMKFKMACNWSSSKLAPTTQHVYVARRHGRCCTLVDMLGPKFNVGRSAGLPLHLLTHGGNRP